MYSGITATAHKVSLLPIGRSTRIRTASSFVIAFMGPFAIAQTEPAAFVLEGDYYRYGFFGQGSIVDGFGPVQDSFGISYKFDDGGMSDRSAFFEIGLTGSEGVLAVTLGNQVELQAPRLAGNDFGAGFTVTADIYVLGPPATPYFLQRELLGDALAIRGGGAGTTQAHTAGQTAVINNGSGTQSVPVVISTGRVHAGSTTTTPHPSKPGYFYAATLSYSLWGFTYQGIDFCFPGCPDILSFTSSSVLSGAVAAGPCCPQDGSYDYWNCEGSSLQSCYEQSLNNCYNYATNRRTFGFSQPGGQTTPPDGFTCENVTSRVLSDGLTPIGDPESCGPTDCVVALVVGPAADNEGWTDYHWYRRNADGTWTHKPGATAAKDTDSNGDVITDPQSAGRGVTHPRRPQSLPGYTDFCGYFCVPCEFTFPAPTPTPSGGIPGPPGVLISLGIFSGALGPQWISIDSAEIDLLRAMIYAGNPSTPLVERDALGYSGLFIESFSASPDFPDFVRVLDGIIAIEDDGVLEYRDDVMGLEDYLLDEAVDQGLGDFIGPGDCPPDLAEPFGDLDFSDVFAFLVAFSAMDPEADFAEPIGVFDFSDVFAFISAFGAGCP